MEFIFIILKKSGSPSFFSAPAQCDQKLKLFFYTLV